MRRARLAGLPLRRAAKKVPSAVTVTDLVRRDFHRDGPNELWVTDITEHPTRESKVYCCVVLDVFSRRVVGWGIDSRARAELATSALGMAIESRSNDEQIPGGIIHADHGTQFTSWTFTERAHRAGLLPSLGTVGDAYDNTRSRRRSGHECGPSYSTGKAGTPASSSPNAIFEYIQGFYNRRRRHSALDWQTPLEFESVAHQPTTNS
ncbi:MULTISPECIES: DDE-type integrase/transposase/recombinase [unclassified Frankia]|uniref:DDE-type integrase/transposase/recombinase n=1 Tax=unclassified Frankia TaxID=2632575 RepID=UPI001EE4C348|nr:MULTISPECIES: DDE-type integrase/transposase/recombinase [unclassified Frankia]